MRKSYSELGLRSGRRAPSATACGRSKAYRPRKLMCLKASGETLAMSSWLMSQPSRVSWSSAALIRHRPDEGRQAAKRRCVSFGRPRKLRPDQKALALALVQEGRSISEVARTFNVHPATIHRCLNAPQASEAAL